MSIEGLNDDLLILIFSYCSQLDRANLHKVSERFQIIVEIYFFKEKCRNLLIATHDKPTEYLNRSFGELKFSDRLDLYNNWFNGSYSKTVYLQHKEIYCCHLQLDSKHLYVSNLGELRIYERGSAGLTLKEKIGKPENAEITQLVKKDKILLGAKINGEIFTYTKESDLVAELFASSFDTISSLDYHGDMVVVASDKETRILNFAEEFGMMTFNHLKFMKNIYSDVKISPDGRTILALDEDYGVHFSLLNSETLQRSRLKFVNSECNQVNAKWIRPDWFLLNMDPHYMSLIDVRAWPHLGHQKLYHHYRLSCFDFDGKHGVVCGTNVGLLVLLDLRKPNECVRLYDLETKDTEYHPNHNFLNRRTMCKELIFDERHLFLSTNNEINLLNFSI